MVQMQINPKQCSTPITRYAANIKIPQWSISVVANANLSEANKVKKPHLN